MEYRRLRFEWILVVYPGIGAILVASDVCGEKRTLKERGDKRRGLKRVPLHSQYLSSSQVIRDSYEHEIGSALRQGNL
jgi:hypothetical protein